MVSKPEAQAREGLGANRALAHHRDRDAPGAPDGGDRPRPSCSLTPSLACASGFDLPPAISLGAQNQKALARVRVALPSLALRAWTAPTSASIMPPALAPGVRCSRRQPPAAGRNPAADADCPG